jgi:hypothetical protein
MIRYQHTVGYSVRFLINGLPLNSKRFNTCSYADNNYTDTNAV